jgi:hypothetical protein
MLLQRPVWGIWVKIMNRTKLAVGRFRLKSVVSGKKWKIVVLGLLFFLIAAMSWTLQSKVATRGIPPEVAALKSSTLTFSELSRFFGDLANKKGAVYAYRVLREATLPPQTDMHLLGHVVGDALYRQEGKMGITKCTDEFRNACSHSIVVGLFSEYGEKAFEEIASVCKNAPGGSGAYTMCYHGLGHGVLAAMDYDLPKATEICMRTGTPQYNMREAVECAGGAVMELLSGGFHNPTQWEKKRAEYLSPDDPFGLCMASFMPASVHGICLEYLTPYLFVVAGGDMASPTREAIASAMQFCTRIPAVQWGDKEACYRGFGKEFVALVHARDIRNIAAYTDDELSTIYSYCKLAPEQTGVTACTLHATNSLYWGAENPWSVAVRFCDAITDSPVRTACMYNLIGAVGYYKNDASYRQEFCAGISQDFQTSCRAQLGV